MNDLTTRRKRAGESVCSFVKLPTGSWGIRSEKEVCKGELVLVRRKDGQEKYETVKEVIQKRGKFWICEIVSPMRDGCVECGARVVDRGLFVADKGNGRCARCWYKHTYG